MRMNFARTAVILAAAATIVGGSTAAASAGTGAPRVAPAGHVKPADSTAGCQAVWSPNCATVVVAQSAIGSDDLIPEDDFAATVDVGAGNPNTPVAYDPIELSFNNNLLDGSQDFAWQQVATVPGVGGSSGAYNFTGFDRHNYGGDPIFEIRYVPNGIDTDLCVTVSSKYRHDGLVLGNCISAGQQVFIVTSTAPFLATAPSGYTYVLQVSHSNTDAQEHNAVLAPHPSVNGSLLAAGTPLHAAAGAADLDEWASIP
jgi:hypothetical protein